MRGTDATGVLAVPARPGDRLRLISTNEVFDGAGPTAAATGRTTAADQPVRPSKLAGEQRAAAATPASARQGGSDRPDGVALRAARRRLPDEDPRAAERARPEASRSGSSATRSARRPTPTTSPRRSSTCSADVAAAGIHHVVNAGSRVPRRLGARRAPPGGDRRPDRGGPAVDLAAGVDAAGVGRPRTDAAPSGEPLRPWQEPWPTTSRSSSPRRAAMSPTGDAGRSQYGDRPRTPTSAARSASCGAASTCARSTRHAGAAPAPSRASSRPTCRPRRRASSAGCISTAASSTTGSSRPAGRSSRSSTSGPCSPAPRGADRRDARAGRRRPGSRSRSASRTASWPSSRSSSSTS